MPLLKVDQFGNVYQFGFGDEIQKAEITSHDGNVAYGEYGKKSEQKRRQAEMKKIAEQNKIAAMKKQKAIQAQAQLMDKEARAKKLKMMQQKKHQALVKKQSDEYLRVVKAGKNPFTGSFQQAGSGSELVGFKAPSQYVSRKKMGQGYVRGVQNASNNGNTMLQKYNWPPRSKYSSPRTRKTSSRITSDDAAKLIGAKRKTATISYAHPMLRVNRSMAHVDGMGFRIRMPKIRMPRINLPRIKVPSLNRVISDAGKLAGGAMKAMNPITHIRKVAEFLPGVRDVYKGLDKLTGNTLTSLERVTNLPAKALEGKPIGKAELIEAAMMAFKVGAIVVSGGSAVALIGAAAGALKEGPLGKTALGNTLLSIGEVGSLASIGKQGIAKAIQGKATAMLSAQAATEVGKKAGPLGAIAASVAVSAGSAGFNTPGSAIPNGATANAAKQAVAVSAKAATMATTKLAESGMKFSTDAAKAEAQKLIVSQAKSHVANEFKARTGIPLGLAMDVANGKVPSPTEIKKQMITDLRNSPDKLKAELAKIPKQKDMADFAMKKVLEEKERVYQREIVQRIKDVEKVKEMGAKEIVKYNSGYKIKAELYKQKVDAMQNVATQAKDLREKAIASTTNMQDKLKFDNDASKLELKLLAMKKDSDPLGNEIADMSVKSEEIVQDNAARMAIAEYGGKTKYTEGTDVASGNDLRHPMLAYGLV